MMIVEHVHLTVKPNQSQEYEQAFELAKHLIAKMHGFNSLQLIKHHADEQRYILMVIWDTIEDHIDGFRQSAEYQEWRTLLHPFYVSKPQLEYYQPCILLKVK